MPAMSTVELCGCELMNAQGRADVNAAKAIAFETGLIQERGFEGLKEVNRILDPLVPVRPANPNEGEDPRDFIEYRFGLGNANLAAVDEPFAGGTVETAVTIDTPEGPQNLTVTQKRSGSALCDNRSVTLQAGADVRHGTTKMLPDIESPCICVWDFARTSEFGSYLGQLRQAMPAEMATMKERQLLRDLVGLSKYNVSESGEDEPVFTEGYFPHIPIGGATVSTFEKIRDRHRRQGHMGPITAPISSPSLQAMMIAYYNALGIQHQVNNWISGAFPDSWANEGTFLFQGIRFKAEDTPILGIFVQTATNRFDFVPISPRKWRAGTSAGAIYDYDEDYDKPSIVWNGARYDVYELSPVISPRAFYQQPLKMNPVNISGVSDDGTMWNGTTIRTIGGAFIPCNEKLNKFKLQLSLAFRLVPIRPYLSAFVAFRKADYLRYNNQVGLIAGQAAVSDTPLYAGEGIQPNANSCADARAGLYPIDPAPGPLSSVCDDVENTAGVFRTPCVLVVDEEAGTVTLVVERINGTEGAASIAYALNDGTGVAGTDYVDASGTLSWADGEYGPKQIVVTIPDTASNGKTFTVAFSGATGASLIEDGCETTTITINRPAHNYELADTITGDLSAMTVNGGAFALPNAPYDDSAAGASALADDINDLLNGDGFALVSYSAGWHITVTDTRHVFEDATAASGSSDFDQS